MIIPDNKKVTELQDFTRKNLNPKEDICRALQELNIQENGKKESFYNNSNLKSETKALNDDVEQLNKKFVQIAINGNQTDQNLGKITHCNFPENKNLTDTISLEYSDENDLQCDPIKGIKKEGENNKIHQNVLILPENSEGENKEEIFVDEVGDEKKNEPEDKKGKSSDLCSRGPIQNRIYRSHEKPPLCSRSHDSGGIVVVAEDPVHRNHLAHKITQQQNLPPNVHPQNIPLQNLCVQNVHSQNHVFQKIPVQSIPEQNIPVLGRHMHNQNISVQNIPVQNIPIQNIPMHNISVQNIPVQHMHTHNIQPQNLRHNFPLQMSSENIHHQNISPQNMYHNIQLENIPHQNVPIQNMTQNIPLQTITPQTMSPPSMSPPSMSPPSMSPPIMSPPAMSPQTLSLQTMSPQTMSPQTMSPQTMSPQTIPPQNLLLQNMPPQNMPPQNMRSQNVPPQNMSPRNMRLQNMSPRNMPPQNMSPQNMPPQNIPSQHSSCNIPGQNIAHQNIPSHNVSMQKVPHQCVSPQTVSDFNLTAEPPTQNSCSMGRQEENIISLWENDDLENIALIAKNPVFADTIIKLLEDCDVWENTKDNVCTQRVQQETPCTTIEDTQTEDVSSNKTVTGNEICSDRGSIGESDLGKLTESSDVSEMSPKSNESSLGSPQIVSHYNHLSPSNASTSGVSSYKDSPQYEGNEHGGDSWFTRDWMKKNIKYTPGISGKPPDRILCPKPPQSKTDPDSARAKLLKKLDDSRRPKAWGIVYSKPNDFFTKGDNDGDTQLMILVSNKFVAQLECIHAMVERMRTIPNSLGQVNKALQSALYIACLEMKDEPLVPAYIAEALAEQNIDVAKLTYENGKTLPEILQMKGDSHKEVLKELLSVKNSTGQYIFQPNRHDINGNSHILR